MFDCEPDFSGIIPEGKHEKRYEQDLYDAVFCSSADICGLNFPLQVPVFIKKKKCLQKRNEFISVHNSSLFTGERVRDTIRRFKSVRRSYSLVMRRAHRSFSLRVGRVCTHTNTIHDIIVPSNKHLKNIGTRNARLLKIAILYGSVEFPVQCTR